MKTVRPQPYEIGMRKNGSYHIFLIGKGNSTFHDVQNALTPRNKYDVLSLWYITAR